MKVNARGILNEKGYSTAGTLFWIVFLALSIYAGYKLVPPYVEYRLFKTDVEEESKLAHMYGNDKLTMRMLAKARDWSVPIDKEDIIITRDTGEINVTVYYTVTVDFAGLYHRDFEYYIDVTEPLMESSGTMH
ncbi:MAG: hypothetical protein HY894_02895 [Deltaproteobacteria bacterium]|nr:hypothetical protein [Deltaproteobacteria bacterium]